MVFPGSWVEEVVKVGDSEREGVKDIVWYEREDH